MARIKVGLQWDGVWRIERDCVAKSIPSNAGFYMVLCGQRCSDSERWDPGTYHVMYIGEAQNIRSRIVNHNEWDCWEEHCQENILLKAASCSLHEEERKKIECCLVYNVKPICNQICKDNFPHAGDIVEIENKGKFLPLDAKYSCRGRGTCRAIPTR